MSNLACDTSQSHDPHSWGAGDLNWCPGRISATEQIGRVAKSEGVPGIPLADALQPEGQREERAWVWSRYDAQFLRERPSSLEDLEAFCDAAREHGAPDHAVIFGLPQVVRAGWYES